ncbi:MAG: hypothetical protein IJF72_03225 [Clostridia bacterium]|nr:hypothetical protein [Clostridia bacterium]
MNKFLKLSLITFTIGVAILVLAFFSFHYLTDTGISSIWNEEADKPYITELLGDLGIINIAVASTSLLIYFIFDKNKTIE